MNPNIKGIAEEICDVQFSERVGWGQRTLSCPFLNITSRRGGAYGVIVILERENFLQRECESIYELAGCIRKAIVDARWLCTERLRTLPCLLPEKTAVVLPELTVETTPRTLDEFVRSLYPEAEFSDSPGLLDEKFIGSFSSKKTLTWRTESFRIVFRPIRSLRQGDSKITPRWWIRLNAEMNGARSEWGESALPDKLGVFSEFHIKGGNKIPSNIALTIFVREGKRMTDLLELLPPLKNESTL